MTSFGDSENIQFSKGEVVVLSFPFSDLSASKRRPALIVANLQGDDIILCQITSESKVDDYSLSPVETDFIEGNLSHISSIRPNKLFTADKSIILYKVGILTEKKMQQVEETLIKIFRN